MDNANRDAAAKAAALWDEAHAQMEDLRRQLGESQAHQKAQAQLVDELRLELAQSRTAIDTYRADAESARADTVSILGCLANAKSLLDGFQIPSEQLPMRRRKNGKGAEPHVNDANETPSAELSELAKRIDDIAQRPEDEEKHP